MKELRDIVSAFNSVIARGDQAVLASVVQTSGSTYRHAGARALIVSDELIVGVVSGGCLESDLTQQAKGVRASGQSMIIRYDHRENDDIVWGLGLGCAGVVDVLLERVDKDNPGPLNLIAQVIETRMPALMATVIAANESTAGVGARWMQQSNGQVSTSRDWPFSSLQSHYFAEKIKGKTGAVVTNEGAEILIERVNPLTRLLIFGAGADAVPLVAIGAEIGWIMEVFDKRSVFASPERFPRADRIVHCPPSQLVDKVALDPQTVAIVMTHNYLQDLDILKFLLPLSEHYIGVLGPKRRLKLLLSDLQEDGIQISAHQQKRLYGPAGLDIGADSAEEIALSIISEVQAVLHQRSGGLLRDRVDPIHCATRDNAA